METTQVEDNNKSLYKTKCKGGWKSRKIVTKKARGLVIISSGIKNVPIKSPKTLLPPRLQFKIPAASKTPHLKPKPTQPINKHPKTPITSPTNLRVNSTHSKRKEKQTKGKTKDLGEGGCFAGGLVCWSYEE